MSLGQGGDDDVEDKIEELIDEVSELTSMMKFLIQEGSGQEPGEGGDDSSLDKWDKGTSTAVRSLEEFKKWRRKAATNEGVSTPYFATNDLEEYDSVMEAHVDLYIEGFQNLQELYSTLGVGGFEDFVQEFARKSSDPSVASSGIVSEELIDILDPSASFFGIEIIESEVKITPALTPFSFVEVYDYTWHSSAEPMKKLGLPEPEDAVPVIGSFTAKEVNTKMAKVIDRRKNLDLPDKYEDLI